MSVINFTKTSCKTNDVINKTLVENFEEHFAMYSLTTIKKVPTISVVKDSDNVYYIIKCKKEECDEIINTLSSYQCSHFMNTLSPIINKIDDGLRIEFEITGEH